MNKEFSSIRNTLRKEKSSDKIGWSINAYDKRISSVVYLLYYIDAYYTIYPIFCLPSLSISVKYFYNSFFKRYFTLCLTFLLNHIWNSMCYHRWTFEVKLFEIFAIESWFHLLEYVFILLLLSIFHIECYNSIHVLSTMRILPMQKCLLSKEITIWMLSTSNRSVDSLKDSTCSMEDRQWILWTIIEQTKKEMCMHSIHKYILCQQTEVDENKDYPIWYSNLLRKIWSLMYVKDQI